MRHIKTFQRYLTNSELRLYLGIILICTLLITLALLHSSVYQSVIETVRHAFFRWFLLLQLRVYNHELRKLASFCKTILFFLMFVGGSAGSRLVQLKLSDYY